MEYGYLDSILVGVKITLTLLPIALLVVVLMYVKSKLDKKSKK